MALIPRFAKKGSTKLDILNKMYDELMSDPQVKPKQLALDYCTCQHTIGSYPNFASIPASYYNALVEHYVYERCAYNPKVPAHKDLSKVNFDFENHEVDEADPSRAIHSKFPDGTEMIGFGLVVIGNHLLALSFILTQTIKSRLIFPRKVIAIVQSVTPLGVVANVVHRNLHHLM